MMNCPSMISALLLILAKPWGRFSRSKVGSCGSDPDEEVSTYVHIILL